MKLNEHKELKKEILALPPKEKDKLLLRLVAKDKVLTEHLHFLLLEDGSDLVDRVETIKQNISKTLQALGASKSTTAKEVLANLRTLAKQVNHNFRVTKAAFEDVELRIFLFNECQIDFKLKRYSSSKDYEHIFAVYFIKTTLLTFKKFEKLHEDLQYDLKEDFNKLLTKIHSGNLANIALELGLPTQI
jgi:hypothetical protein